MDSRSVLLGLVLFFVALVVSTEAAAAAGKSCPQKCNPDECPEMEGDCLAGMIMVREEDF